MSMLRAIAVSVEEHKPEQFSWVLLERRGDAWHALDEAPAPVPSYQRAMAEGLLALQDLIEDLDRGPRVTSKPSSSATGKAARQAPAGKAAVKEDADARGTPASGKLYFGFGPAR